MLLYASVPKHGNMPIESIPWYVCFCAHSFTANALSFVLCIFTICRIVVVEFQEIFLFISQAPVVTCKTTTIKSHAA